jgi:hypothetical protein
MAIPGERAFFYEGGTPVVFDPWSERLADDSLVDGLDVRYKSVNFGTKPSQGPPNLCPNRDESELAVFARTESHTRTTPLSSEVKLASRN